MRFSDIQKKEVIDVEKGTFLGFIQDATIDTADGKVKSLHVGGGDRSVFFDTRDKEVKKVPLGDVATIGKDIILVGQRGLKK
ncbi:ylmc/ymxh family sporulation protein [Bacillus sp. OxB-1]|uniref:PRC-barrel domain-containing protein n=1 Tax=Bacillus sp. (strain OxB-1) TaxID=98228 RepID=UPI0005822AFA|nr:YlmC/YmxH family sporulation protein [Bacillus sp. OxB-1]BAQ10439.1 ylmc/ymxh family sporulation protein [Bacillus sp. OxB-1]